MGSNILWNPSMNRPTGGPFTEKDLTRVVVKEIGSGVMQDPSITWFWNLKVPKNPRSQKERKLAKLELEVERIVREHAVSLQCPFAWIFGAPHPFTTAYTKTGLQIKKDDPMHITARFGSSPDNCLFATHLYVKVDEYGSLTFGRDDGGLNPMIWAWGNYPRQWVPKGSQDQPRTTKPQTKSFPSNAGKAPRNTKRNQ